VEGVPDENQVCRFLLDELMSGSVKDIEAFIASREDGLFEEDHRAMLEYKEAKKRPRATLVPGLKTLVGDEE
jgi:hypothetical protein